MNWQKFPVIQVLETLGILDNLPKKVKAHTTSTGCLCSLFCVAKACHKLKVMWTGFPTCRRPLGGFPQDADWRQVAWFLSRVTILGRVASTSITQDILHLNKSSYIYTELVLS